ncbi:MAG: polysaccharide biosynthesis/export family protein [Vicinamibacterales bacterium]
MPLIKIMKTRRQSLTRTLARVAIASLCGVTLFAGQALDYVVGTQDVLTLAVWDQPEMSGKYTVGSDGTIALPLLGRVKVMGLSVRDAENELKRRLGDGFLKNPQLTVSIEQSRTQKVYILGEVRSPNAYPYTSSMTIVEALAQAGSTTEEASQEALVVRPREGPATGPNAAADPELFHVDLKKLAAGDFKENVPLRGGDTIIISKVGTFFVLGQVKSPGRQPAHQATTVMQALSLAGGVTDRGSQDRVRIIRTVNGKQVELKAKLSDLIQTGDTVVVLSRIL